MDSENSNAKIQHVNKKSSDELLRKFAELGDEKKEARKELRLAKRRKRIMSSSGRRGGEYCESPLNNNGSGSLVERKWLLPPAAAARRPPLLRQLGIGRSQLRARDIRNKSLFGTIEKTWRKTVEGASRVFMEKHYNRHKRLINDVV
ncbi:hypothetical protein WN944_004601 [Citrus x changshan-huyou]|uniref:Uncharacterized protein n=4 Tax=Citrus TaxID=2706 RepID=A0ACB8JYI9_CITSI|nr:uncharacterized protein LOC18039646 [Citrus x clementina]ESR43120.1 hypothetical protein CICLE_v10013031mg [Citrus x clementina]KAH9737563.1 hypothetical protein KPL71_018486 [Citrus sinensis]KDO70922.1 hypothetical protein CISIN_1g035775mg [Citrus sinensis]